MAKHTFVKKASVWGDDMEELDILSPEEIQALIKQGVDGLSQELAREGEQRERLEKEFSQALREEREERETWKRGMEEKNKRALTNVVRGELTEMLADLEMILKPHFQNLAALAQGLQEEETHLRKMHQAMQRELATIQAVSSLFCQIQQEDLRLQGEMLQEREAILQGLWPPSDRQGDGAQEGQEPGSCPEIPLR